MYHIQRRKNASSSAHFLIRYEDTSSKRPPQISHVFCVARLYHILTPNLATDDGMGPTALAQTHQEAHVWLAVGPAQLYRVVVLAKVVLSEVRTNELHIECHCLLCCHSKGSLMGMRFLCKYSELFELLL